MTLQSCFMYWIVVMMAISYMATVVEGSAQGHPSNFVDSRKKHLELKRQAVANNDRRSAKCLRNVKRRATLAKIIPSSLQPNPPKGCPDTTNRRLLQHGADEIWDEYLFDCTTNCTDAANCVECDDTTAGACGDVLATATEDLFDDYTDPAEGWNASCALAVEVADPTVGTQCVVCFFAFANPSAATSTPSAGGRCVHGHLHLAFILLNAALAGVGVVFLV